MTFTVFSDTFSYLSQRRSLRRPVQRGVESPRRQQLLMGPRLRHAALVQHQNTVGPADGGQAVGDDKAGTGVV